MKSKIIGSEIIRLNTTDSTNDYCLKLLKENDVAEGIVVSADEQTAGRGYRENQWESEKGKNLTFSIALFPDFLKANQQFLLSEIISLGITDFLSLYKNNVSIKWPNDIMIGEKKAGGILIENVIQENKIIMAVTGVGLNINQTEFNNYYPEPVSLKSILGVDLDLEECLSLLCDSIEKRYIQLKDNNIDAINSDYINGLYRYKKMCSYKDKNGEFKAKIIDVAVSGHLVVKTETGEIRNYDFKEIVFI